MADEKILESQNTSRMAGGKVLDSPKRSRVWVVSCKATGAPGNVGCPPSGQVGIVITSANDVRGVV